ncbi:NAD dependent epimerase/dehydratase family protein [Immersiella caudata]|uniref:NAD dependent epimerase/dehydratase family protein n=1 Tax=Immersiella caudata TaxID=314043 RepID=A0AA39WJ11_9PEZI|nr:NAD dependent epimerase/dehydratase family protein [Immersiella caudata]
MAPKILLTGATGFIGGTVLTTLLASPSESLKTHPITILLRSSSAAATLTATYGDRVKPILYSGLDDTEKTTSVASSHDIVINCTLGYHAPSGLALIRGLAQRKVTTGQPVWYIHTSGTSNLGDRPVSGKYLHSPADRSFNDATDDIYTYEKTREAASPYPQRTAELAAIDLGLELSVSTLIIMSPLIYGIGTGLFNKMSVQIPAMVRMALMTGRSIVLGPGSGMWDHVHVEDTAALYRVVIEAIAERGGEGVPTGKRGILFGGNGLHSWREVAQGVADACFEAGKIADRTVVSVSIADVAEAAAAELNGIMDGDIMEAGFASNSRTVATVGRKLGWAPARGEEFWRKTFADDLRMVLEK